MSKKAEEARQWVIDAETAFLPKGYPLPFTDVLEAKFVGKVVIAQVRMFDGLLATLEVFQYRIYGFLPSWGSRWIELPGGDISCEDKKWKRVKEEIVQGVLWEQLA